MSDTIQTNPPNIKTTVLATSGVYKVGGALSWVPSLSMIRTRMLELRKRHGLMFAVILLTVGLPIIVLGIREITHLSNSAKYGPAGSPSLFATLTDPMSLLGFIIGATLGATAGSTDITEGFFRLLVATGRSRVSMYFSRMAAGSAILLSLVGLGFTILCLVTCFAGQPQNPYVNVSGLQIPVNLSESHVQTWLLGHESQVTSAVQQGPGPSVIHVNRHGSKATSIITNPGVQSLGNFNPTRFIKNDINAIYSNYMFQEVSSVNPRNSEMIKVGLWLELVAFMGFIIGLSLGAAMGQRTVPTILLLVLQVIITPILSNLTIPHFINGQRLLIGVALTQLRPVWTLGGVGGGGGGSFGGINSLGIAPLPTWGMIAVILLWAILFTSFGAWRMANREA